MGADRLATRQLPSARAVAKRLAGQRAHRAKVNHVARQFGIHRHTDKGFDLCIFTTVRHAQFHHASYFLAKAHTAGAMDAAAHLLHGDQRADILVKHRTFFFLVTRFAGTIAHSQILQLAFAALITNGAVEWMIDQQEFHHALLGLNGFFVLGVHDHALRHGRGARRYRLGGLFNINQAHAAVGSNAQLFVITKVRNISAGFFSSVHHCAAIRHFHLLAVEFYFNHIFFFLPFKPARRRGLQPELRLWA